MKKLSLLLLLLPLLILNGCTNTPNYSNININTDTEVVNQETASEYTNYVNIKYRDDPVNIADFETVDTSKSSLVRGAWYDRDNQYMIIDLNWTKYHYCRFPSSTWSSFTNADSFGTYYESYIKWSYDCRNWWIPSY